MSKFFTDNGLLTEVGKGLLIDFSYGLVSLMQSDEVHDMTDDEIRTLQSNLNKMIGDVVANTLSQRLRLEDSLQKMSDEEFDDYLKKKYGDNWMMVSLEPEEFKRVPLLDLEKLQKDMRAVGESLKNYMAHKLKVK